MRQIVWVNLLHLPNLMDGSWINIIIAVCIPYFILCSLIEWIRLRAILKIKKRT